MEIYDQMGQFIFDYSLHSRQRKTWRLKLKET